MKVGCVVALCVEPAEVLCRSHLLRLAWTCYGKTRYRHTFAVKEAKRRTARDRGVGQPSTGYKCPVCSSSHVGHVRPGTLERRLEAQLIVRALRTAGQIRLLSTISEDWSPLRGADRTGHWTDKVRI